MRYRRRSTVSGSIRGGATDGVCILERRTRVAGKGCARTRSRHVRVRQPEDRPDDDLGRPGSAIGDPLLKKIRRGPDREPGPRRLGKRDPFHGDEAATGGPPAGRMSIDEARRRGPVGWLHVLGPGLITGASDDDPSGIGTYSLVGSQFGYGLLWTALVTFPLMASVQELCARIALQTGVGLGTSLRRRFPTWLVGVCILALFVANTINVGADLGAVAAGGSLLTRGAVPELWLVVPVALLIVGMQLFVTYSTIFKTFKWLTIALFAYVVTGVLAHPDLRQLLVSTFVPQIKPSRDYIAAIVAVLGTTISPYLFFWQAASEVDEMRAAGKRTEQARRGVRHAELRAARTDILVGMFFSNAVMYSIMVTSAAVLHAHGKTGIASAGQAAEALAPLAGQWAFALFAVGMIGTGLLAIPILSGSAAYAVKDFLGLKGGLADRASYRPTFYLIMILSTAAGVAINLIGINPIRALYVTAVINGLVAPPLLVLIVILGSSREIMASHVSGRLSKVLTWATAAGMSAAAVALVVISIAP
jgi:NRAMP (natural resistance-associated macrophage protein)-like metal ion transporter